MVGELISTGSMSRTHRQPSVDTARSGAQRSPATSARNVMKSVDYRQTIRRVSESKEAVKAREEEEEEDEERERSAGKSGAKESPPTNPPKQVISYLPHHYLIPL